MSENQTHQEPAPTTIGPRVFAWGERTFVMGILNATPDSFSGDGLLAKAARGSADVVALAVATATRMAAEGADMLDIGGESTRPGHATVDEANETARVVPIIAAVRAALPDMPISIDTTKRSVADAALTAGADMVNDVWGVADDDGIPRVAAEHGAAMVVMHNREAARYTNLIGEILDDLERAVERAVRAGVARERIVVDPGFGFGKTPVQNLTVVRELNALRALGRPVLLGASRKSTLGKVLDLPAEDRLEATLATTALAVAGGADIVRVHDVIANVRVARVADAIIRGNWQPSAVPGEGGLS